MKFNCSVNELIQAVTIVQHGVALKSTNSIIQGILFSAEQDQLILTSTNQEISIKYYIPANVEENGSIVLNAGFISEIFRKLSGDTVFFESTGPLQIKVECLLSSFILNGLPTDEFPDFPNIDEHYSMTINASELKKIIHKTILSVAVNDSIPVLTGIKFEVNDDVLTMIALDGYRLALCRNNKITKNGNDFSVIIPGKSLQEVNRILSGKNSEVLIRFSETQVFFEIDEIRFASRLLEGEFINYHNIIPSNYSTEVILERKLLLESSERAALLAKEGKNNLILMDFSIDYVELNSSADIGQAKEIIPIQQIGEDIRIAFNSKYIIDALKVIDDEKIKIKMTTSVGPAVLTASNEPEEYLFLVLPVRIPETM